MTREELYNKHYDTLNTGGHADISIEYTISVLQEVANPEYQIISDGQSGIVSIPKSSIYDKIKELSFRRGPNPSYRNPIYTDKDLVSFGDFCRSFDREPALTEDLLKLYLATRIPALPQP